MNAYVVNILDITFIAEYAIASILHSFGLYVILSLKMKKVMTLLMMHLSLLELICVSTQVIQHTRRYIYNHWLIESNIYYTILNFLFITFPYTDSYNVRKSFSS